MNFEKSYSIPAKPAPVFDALTSALHLRTWFAEQVEIGAKAGDPFRFWGKHTLWVPEATDAKQTLARLEFPTALEFLWTWRGVPTEVAIRVAADAEGTRVDLKHAFARPWPASDPALGSSPTPDRVVAAFWSLAIRNLSHYLFEGEPVLLPDLHAAAESGSVRLEITVDAPPEAIFEQLVDPAALDAWIAERARVDARPDGEYSYGWTSGMGEPVGPTRVLRLRRAESLVHDWRFAGGEASEVRWEIEPQPLGTCVRVVHADIGTRAALASLEWGAALSALRERVVVPD